MVLTQDDLTYLEDWIAERIEPVMTALARTEDRTARKLFETTNEIGQRGKQAEASLRLIERNIKEVHRSEENRNQRVEDITQELRGALRKPTFRAFLWFMAAAVSVAVVAPSVYGAWRYIFSEKAARMKRLEMIYDDLPRNIRSYLDGN